MNSILEDLFAVLVVHIVVADFNTRLDSNLNIWLTYLMVEISNKNDTVLDICCSKGNDAGTTCFLENPVSFHRPLIINISIAVNDYREYLPSVISTYRC